jgi:hypothetical protein
MKKALFIVLTVSLVSACSMNTVQYQPDFNLVNDMKDNNLQKMSIGDISSKNPDVNKVSIRGSSMVSTFNNSYAKYLEVALREQLQQANLYDSSSSISIVGDLLKNEVNAAGFSVGTAEITTRFKVLSSDKVIFDKVVTITHEWDSSFVGAIAIPNAQNNYPIAIQKLISKLMTEQDFISSVKGG